ncbi:MAG: hypothetical protein Kow0029_00690 [Candidatus Rifleibacteriota bacterium]
MFNDKVIEQVSDLMVQVLSDESVSIAEPMTDVEIQLLSAVIDQTITEKDIDESMSLVADPRELIKSIKSGSLAESSEILARKTLRRFYELFINLTAEPETRTLN